MSYTSSCFPAGSRVLGKELQLLALEHPNAGLALGSALPSVLILLPSLQSPALTERAKLLEGL